MTRPLPHPPEAHAPILTWDQVHEALTFVTTPDTKLALIPSVMSDLQGTNSPRQFALALAVHLSLLADPAYSAGAPDAPVD